jgi:DNA gyrase/topoisomerase IV subunit A
METAFILIRKIQKRTKFMTTLEVIKIYAAKEYKTKFTRMKDTLFEKFNEPILLPPPKVSDSATEIDKLIFIKDYKSHKNDKKELDNALMALFDIIIGQCSPLLKLKLKALQSWEQIKSKFEI